MIRRSQRLLSVLAILLGSAASRNVSAAIEVVREPIKVEHRTFDPENKPKEMPPLHDDEVAVCWSEYGSAVQLLYVPRGRRMANGKYEVSLIVNKVEAKISMSIVVWLPKVVSDKIRAHEEAHRQISEKMYDEVAERAMRSAADKLDGRRFTGEGATADDAQAAAQEKLNEAQSAMIRAYLDDTSVAGQKIQVEFDELTSHGRRAVPDEAEGIKEAWAKHPPALWEPKKGSTTGPAATESDAKGAATKKPALTGPAGVARPTPGK